MKNRFRTGKHLTGAVGIGAIFFLILLFWSVIVGIMYGAQIGAKYGPWLAVAGGVVGSVLGVVFAIGVMFFAALVSWPFEAFSQWWRPYPPQCENKSCPMSRYTAELLQEDFKRIHPGFSSIGWRCKQCGNLYASLLLTGRWARIFPDGGLQPYLKYKPFGRWQPDFNTDFTPPVPVSEGKFFGFAGLILLIVGIIFLSLSRSMKHEWITTSGIVGTVCGAFFLFLVGISSIQSLKHGKGENTGSTSSHEKGNIPGWVLPWFMALFTGGTVFLAVFFQRGMKEPISRWLVIGSASIGFLCGSVAWFVEFLKNRKISRIGTVSFAIILDVIKFFGLKLIALVPGAIAVSVWIFPLSPQPRKDRICVSLITVGLFLLGFFIDGLSFSQFRRKDLSGINRYCPILGCTGLILIMIGFIVGIV